MAALISTATGRKPYFIGKPNPLMMRFALNRLDAHSETTVMVGDRMDTDIKSGLEAGLRTVLVTTGSTRPDQVETFPYRPTRVVDSIADLVELVQPPAPRLSPNQPRRWAARHPRVGADGQPLRRMNRIVAARAGRRHRCRCR